MPALGAARAREKLGKEKTTSTTQQQQQPVVVDKCAPAALALAGLMPGRHGTPGMAPGTVLDHPLYLRTGAVTYIVERVIGNGSFGVVLQAKIEGTAEPVAIKRVLQDKRYKVSRRCGRGEERDIF